jgi:hypothetical protein
MKNKQTVRVQNGVFTPKFIAKHKGQKVIFHPNIYTPMESGTPCFFRKYINGTAVTEKEIFNYDAAYSCEWETFYTPTAEAMLSKTEIVHTGYDGDYVLLKSKDFTIHYGERLDLGYVEIQF